MSKGFWVIIFLTILVAILAVVAGAYYLNFRDRPEVPKELLEKADIDKPVKSVVTDEYLGQLESKLKDSDPITRLDSIVMLNALAKHNPARVGPTVVKALSNEDRKVRYSAAMQLGLINYAAAAGKLTVLLDDEAKEVAIAAGDALAKLGEEGLQAVMEGLSSDKIKDLDRALAVARKITEQAFGQGHEGRGQALKYWEEKRRKAQSR